ncbi:MAG TPA: hypothetical protein VMI94_13275 [Bryobacteraceae bacterium]|nr:hypothetical protein [Bryobacteraceae bacterium]
MTCKGPVSIQESRGVTIAKITGPGLASIAVGVALLWACIIGEHGIVARANAGTAETLRAMRALRLRHRRDPVTAPARPAVRRATGGARFL